MKTNISQSKFNSLLEEEFCDRVKSTIEDTLEETLTELRMEPHPLSPEERLKDLDTMTYQELCSLNLVFMFEVFHETKTELERKYHVQPDPVYSLQNLMVLFKESGDDWSIIEQFFWDSMDRVRKDGITDHELKTSLEELKKF